MAGNWRRIISFELDRSSAQKVGRQMEDTLAKAGDAGGKEFFRELKAQFEGRMAELREKLARGLIDQDEFKRQSAEAARTFNDGIVRGMDAARKQGTLTDREYQKLTKSLKRVGDEGRKSAGILSSGFAKVAGLFAGVFAVNKIREFGASAIKAATEADAVWNRLAGTLETVGVEFTAVEDDIKSAARAMQDTTTVGDEDFAAALTELTSISRDYAGSLENVQVVADLAAAKQIDLKTAAQLVGRAMIGETGTLKRYGIVVEEGADAVEAMRTQFAGMAQNETKTLAGQVKQLGNEWGDLKEAIGGVLIESASGNSIIGTLTASVKGLGIWITDNTDRLSTWGRIGIAAIKGVGTALGGLVKIAFNAGQIIGDTLVLAFEKARLKFAEGLNEWRRALNSLIDGLNKLPGIDIKFRFEEQDVSTYLANVETRTESLKSNVSDLTDGVKMLASAWTTVAHAATVAGQEQAGAAGAPAAGGAPAGPGRASGGAPPGDPRLAALKDLKPTGPVLSEQELGTVTQQAESVAESWGGAFRIIQADAETTVGLVQGALMAVADGGVMGLARFASMRAKAALAEAIGAVAKGIAALTPWGAAMFGSPGPWFAAAAQWGAEAAAWKTMSLATGGGGGGGGGGASIGGGSGSSAGASARTAGNIEKPGTETHIYIDPLRANDPQFVRVVYGAQQNGVRYFGNDATVHVHPHPRSATR